MVKSELRWFFLSRTFWALLFLAIGLSALSVCGTISQLPTDPANSGRLMSETTKNMVQLSFGGSIFSMLFGAMCITNDFHSFAVVRRSFLAGGSINLFVKRAVALLIPVAIFGITTICGVVAVAYYRLPARGYKFETSHDLSVTIAGVAAAIFGMTFLGYFFGWLIKNTVVVITVLVVWNFVLEAVVIGFAPKVGRFLPGGAVQAITLDKAASPEIFSVGYGYVVLFTWVVAMLVAAVLRLKNSDLV